MVKVVLLVQDFICKKNIYDEYLEELKTKAEAIKIGDPISTTTQLGPFATLNQLQNIEEKIKQT